MKRPKLIEDWKRVLKRAWSIRLMLLAGLLSALEVILPMLTHVIPWPRSVSAALIGLVVGLAFVTRLMAQRDERDD